MTSPKEYEYEAIYKHGFHIGYEDTWLRVEPGEKYSGTESMIFVRKEGFQVDWEYIPEIHSKYFKRRGL